MPAHLKYQDAIDKIIEVPNCFCGEEPVFVDNNVIQRTISNEDSMVALRELHLQCPYCHAWTGTCRTYDSFASKAAAVKAAARDWEKMITKQ